jgi:CO/xanthine dehydrogenase FAD-binding subunit
MKKVFLPRTLRECRSILDGEPDARVYAGGTDLLVQMRHGNVDPPALICLERIPELQGVRLESATLRLGAGVTHTALLKDRLVRQYLPVLHKALTTLGSPLIRNMGTVGGNICTASPAGDTLPPLYVLAAEVELHARETIRLMPLSEFITGPGQTQLAKGEILAGIRVKVPQGFNVHHFEKTGQRQALACAIASVAAVLTLTSTGVIDAARLAWGSVGPTIVTSPAVEAALIGERLSQTTLAKAAGLARQAASPIDDTRASAGYRRHVAGNLLLRLATIDLRN